MWPYIACRPSTASTWTPHVPKVAYQETITKSAQLDVPPQEADGRRRPVCRSAHARRPAAARRRLRVHQRSLWRHDQQFVLPLDRKGHQVGPGTVASLPATRSSTSRPSSSTARSTRSTPRTSPSRRRAAKSSSWPSRRPTPCCSSRSISCEVTVPEEYMGDVMSDFNTRRGRVLGMEQKGNRTVIRATVPHGGDHALQHRPALDDARAVAPTRSSLTTTSRCPATWRRRSSPSTRKRLTKSRATAV